MQGSGIFLQVFAFISIVGAGLFLMGFAELLAAIKEITINTRRLAGGDDYRLLSGIATVLNVIGVLVIFGGIVAVVF